MPQQAIAVEGVATSWQSVFNLCNSVIGAGVLSFPFAYRCAGEFLGFLTPIVVGQATTATALKLTFRFSLLLLYPAKCAEGFLLMGDGIVFSCALSVVLCSLVEAACRHTQIYILCTLHLSAVDRAQMAGQLAGLGVVFFMLDLVGQLVLLK